MNAPAVRLDAERFLAALCGDGNITFQTFDDSDQKRKVLSKVLYGSLDRHRAKLNELNTQGAGVFVMVNEGDQRGRREQNVRRVRALFVDLDGAPLEPVQEAALLPHIVVQSSQDRYHAYWMVADCALDKFTALQKALAARFDGDPAVNDLPRVMRLPGFQHRKGEPFEVRLLHVADGAEPYTVAALVEALQLVIGATSGIPAGTRNDALMSEAGRLRATGLAPEEIYRSLLAINASRCNPPLDATEVRGIVQGVSRYPASRPLTDLGNAERLVDACHTRLKFCPQAGRWIAWDGTRWRWDEDGAVHRAMRVVVREMYTVAAAESDENRRSALGKWAARSEAKGPLRAAVELAANDERVLVDVGALDADPWRLGLRNGTLDLRTGDLLPAAPDHLITKQALVAFDPEAQCPEWEKFLAKIFGNDAALIEYVRRAAGYSLTGETMAKTLFFLHGAGGDNGKSTLIETLVSLLGDYALKTRAETFMLARNSNPGATPERVALRGARLVVASELSDRQQFDESFLKDVTGGIDRIAARNLYEGMIQFRPEFKLWLYGNHKPRLRADDDAAWRRLHLIPFEVRIPLAEQDSALGQKLLAELPGILNWALAGLADWRRVQLAAPEKVRAAGAAYRTEMDDLGRFLDERCELAATSEARAGDLYAAYKRWSDDNGQHPMGNVRFSARLAERGTAKRGLHGRAVWVGVRLRDEPF